MVCAVIVALIVCMQYDNRKLDVKSKNKKTQNSHKMAMYSLSSQLFFS